MKEFKMLKQVEQLGKTLSKADQKKIIGGIIDPGKCKKSGSCSTDDDCGGDDYNCVCGTTVVNPDLTCYNLG